MLGRERGGRLSPRHARVLRVPGVPSRDARWGGQPETKPLWGGSGVPLPCPRCFSPPAPGLCSPRDKARREQRPLLLLDSIPSTTSAPSAEWDGVSRALLSAFPSSRPLQLEQGEGCSMGPPAASAGWGFGAVPCPGAEAGGHVPHPLCLGCLKPPVRWVTEAGVRHRTPRPVPCRCHGGGCVWG